MTKRLDNCVVRGELDNRIPGQVSGLLWVNGVVKPVELDLKGDAMRDLAGHRITFSRREPPPADEENLAVPAWRQVVRDEVDDMLLDVIRLIDDVRNLA